MIGRPRRIRQGAEAPSAPSVERRDDRPRSTCAVCGEPVEAKRVDALCSGRCRRMFDRIYRESRRAQGLPLRIEDEATLRKVAALIADV